MTSDTFRRLGTSSSSIEEEIKAEEPQTKKVIFDTAFT
jgi:hypothetical protein